MISQWYDTIPVIKTYAIQCNKQWARTKFGVVKKQVCNRNLK